MKEWWTQGETTNYQFWEWKKYITSGPVHMKLITRVDTKSLPVNPIKRKKVMERHKLPNWPKERQDLHCTIFTKDTE